MDEKSILHIEYTYENKVYYASIITDEITPICNRLSKETTREVSNCKIDIYAEIRDIEPDKMDEYLNAVNVQTVAIAISSHLYDYFVSNGVLIEGNKKIAIKDVSPYVVVDGKRYNLNGWQELYLRVSRLGQRALV